MQDSLFEQHILLSRTNPELREMIIQKHKPYIINTVGHICKRFITWSDEEASIGLLAFNRALDTFKESGGRLFLSYAFLLIQRDLINYFRKNKNNNVISLFQTDEDANVTILDHDVSIDEYKQSVQKLNLVEEILELNEQLNHFGIQFEELERVSPKHRDTRAMLHLMAQQFIGYEDLCAELLTKKRFPISGFIQRTGHSLKTIENYRKYIITLITIRLHPEWEHLTYFIRIDNGKGERP